jgi:hypothetical protein
MTKPFSKRRAVLLAAALLAAAPGCGPTVIPKEQVVPAHGKILLPGGKPASFTILRFIPVTSGIGRTADARVAEDGTFKVRTYSNGKPDGIVPGSYKVAIEPYTVEVYGPLPKGKSPAGVAKKYRNGDTSGILIDVESGEGERELGTIQLK